MIFLVPNLVILLKLGFQGLIFEITNLEKKILSTVRL